MLSVIDGSQVTDNLWGERWSKLCANAMGNPVTAMSGLGSVEAASSVLGRAITIHLAGESARVGLALGYRVPKFNGESAERWADSDAARDLGSARCDADAEATSARNWRASMAQDILKGRPDRDRLYERPRRRSRQDRRRGDSGIRWQPWRWSKKSKPARASPHPRTSPRC